MPTPLDEDLKPLVAWRLPPNQNLTNETKINIMASISDDDISSDSNLSQDYVPNVVWNDLTAVDCLELPKRSKNIIYKLFNRQLYGRFARNPKAKTERVFTDIHHKCRFRLDQIIPQYDTLGHIYMGFTLCGRYFISYTYTENVSEDVAASNEYEIYIWRFVPGQRLQYLSQHRIFKLLKSSEELVDIKFMQFPSDPFKLICYGLGLTNPAMAYVSMLTIPAPRNCRQCRGAGANVDDKLFKQGWCIRHGFILHYMLSMAQPTPLFEPEISLSFPDYLVMNTGHYIHILNISSFEPSRTNYPHSRLAKDEERVVIQQNSNFTDSCSEISSCTSDHFGTNSSVIDAILDDFNEYDLEGNDYNKPFHELNISCEPLNVTGKSYHNTLIHNIVDPRVKRLQNSKDCLFSVPQASGLQKPVEKSKIDKKTAEKAYEFTEENEKCEKLSSFRKKRLADKKYEFSEDNTENIVPFNSLRKERRFLYRSQSRCILSPDLSNALFLSPRSPGIRSPMQSPNSRSGQFSPRNVYASSLRNSPHHSKSPASPRDNARKFNVYSPSLDSDCSDSDSKLVLRQINNFPISSHVDGKYHSYNGLLIVDARKEEQPRWIKKLVRRYSSADFENSSLVSGQSRDDFNIPIEIPLLVQTLTEQQLDVVPEFRVDEVSETQLIVTQRTFDCEQFVQRRAQKLCADSQLLYCHCQDYDIKLMQVCPLNGDIICQAVIKIGALQSKVSCRKPQVYLTSCIFTWNITTDKFELIEPPEPLRLQPMSAFCEMPRLNIPQISSKGVLIMDYQKYHSSKLRLRDYNNFFEIYMEDSSGGYWSEVHFDGYYTVSDSD